LESEDQEKPAIYQSCAADMESPSEKDQFKFNETDTTTVIRRSHVRLDLQAAGLGPRPPSVISSDQEYPPLEHKDIPVPSPYTRKLQQNEEALSQSNIECKTQSKLNAEVKNYTVAETTKINSTEVVSETKIKLSNDGMCQKLVSNAKNDQIKISVEEKIAKNREEVSGKRSSFVEAEGKAENIDKVINCSQEMSQENNLIKENRNEEKYITETVYIETVKSEVNSKKDCIAAVNSILSKRTESTDQPQTTWEQEKQKAELAKLRLSENYSQSPSTGQPSVISQRPPSRKSNEYLGSESSQIEDSDSSDTKTITNAECVMEVQNNTVAAAETSSKTAVNHVTSMTPDTMTPDEAENLLSSR